MPILIFSTFVVFVVVQLLPSCALLWQLFSNLRWWLECQEAGSSEQLWLWGCDQDAKCYCQVIFKSTFWWPGSWAFCPTCVPCSYRFLQLYFFFFGSSWQWSFAASICISSELLIGKKEVLPLKSALGIPLHVPFCSLLCKSSGMASGTALDMLAFLPELHIMGSRHVYHPQV